MASQVQIPFEGVILQEHSAPISCPTPNFAKGSQDKQAEKLLHGKRTDSLIGCVSEVIHERGNEFWESLSKHRRWLNSRW